jgi:hypothetical protein
MSQSIGSPTHLVIRQSPWIFHDWQPGRSESHLLDRTFAVALSTHLTTNLIESTITSLLLCLGLKLHLLDQSYVRDLLMPRSARYTLSYCNRNRESKPTSERQDDCLYNQKIPAMLISGGLVK